MFIASHKLNPPCKLFLVNVSHNLVAIFICLAPVIDKAVTVIVDPIGADLGNRHTASTRAATVKRPDFGLQSSVALSQVHIPAAFNSQSESPERGAAHALTRNITPAIAIALPARTIPIERSPLIHAANSGKS
jgi:hypothetical protein